MLPIRQYVLTVHSPTEWDSSAKNEYAFESRISQFSSSTALHVPRVGEEILVEVRRPDQPISERRHIVTRVVNTITIVGDGCVFHVDVFTAHKPPV